MRFFGAFNCGYSNKVVLFSQKVKQFLLLLVPPQVVSQITVQPGLSTTDSKQPTMPRQVPRECRSILQHLSIDKLRF
ncbi:hypothetical protein Celaphus_00002405, partial [Cervus elaphus hippelaphus]